MKLIDFTLALKFARKHQDASGWLMKWETAVIAAAWESLSDVRKRFASADGVKLKSDIVVTVFNVKGNSYRLLTFIDYEDQTVAVLDVMTHADYSRGAWKARY